MIEHNQKIYLVRWIDAWAGGSSSYYRQGNDYTGLDVYDIGFVMEENDDTLVLCSSVESDAVDAGRSIACIPWEYIVSIEELV